MNNMKQMYQSPIRLPRKQIKNNEDKYTSLRARQRHMQIQIRFQSYDSFYQPMLEELGAIVLQINQEGYDRRDGAGDSYLALSKEGRYGILIVSWGNDHSESDEIYKCTSVAHVQMVKRGLKLNTVWFSSLEKLKEHAKRSLNNTTMSQFISFEKHQFMTNIVQYQEPCKYEVSL